MGPGRMFECFHALTHFLNLYVEFFCCKCLFICLERYGYIRNRFVHSLNCLSLRSIIHACNNQLLSITVNSIIVRYMNVVQICDVENFFLFQFHVAPKHPPGRIMATIITQQ